MTVTDYGSTSPRNTRSIATSGGRPAGAGAHGGVRSTSRGASTKAPGARSGAPRAAFFPPLRASVCLTADLARDGALSHEEAVRRIGPAQVQELLHPQLRALTGGEELLVKGLPASPGAATGGGRAVQ
ncbi:hypothetical protein [Streptomyces shaanxiensis]